MDASYILRIDGLNRTWFEIKPLDQFHAGHALHAVKHRFLGRDTVCYCLIAMRPVRVIENVPRLYGRPKRDVVQRVEPVLNVLNVIKNNHGHNVSNSTALQQI